MNDQLIFWSLVFASGFVLQIAKVGISSYRKKKTVALNRNNDSFVASPGIHPHFKNSYVRHVSPNIVSDTIPDIVPCHVQKDYCPETGFPTTGSKPKEEIDWGALASQRVNFSRPSSNNYFKPKNVPVVIRLLPPPKRVLFNSRFKEVQNPLYVVARQHYINASDNKVYQCGKVHGKEGWSGKCPICSFYETRPHDNLYKTLRPFERYYYNVLRPPYTYPLIWSMSKTTHKKISDLFLDKGNICNISTGRNLSVYTRPVNGYGCVEIKVSPDQTSLCNDFVLANQYDLTKLVDEWNRRNYTDLQNVVESFFWANRHDGQIVAAAKKWKKEDLKNIPDEFVKAKNATV